MHTVPLDSHTRSGIKTRASCVCAPPTGTAGATRTGHGGTTPRPHRRQRHPHDCGHVGSARLHRSSPRPRPRAYSAGHRYEGGWSNDMRDGEGRMDYACGDEYNGGWKAGQRSGSGNFVCRDKYTYSGQVCVCVCMPCVGREVSYTCACAR